MKAKAFFFESKIMMAALIGCLGIGGLTNMIHAGEILKWMGCGITRKAFMTEVAAAYKEKTGIRISLSGGGATKGVRAAHSGIADMGGNCRPALAQEFPAEEANVYLTVVAWDALVPIVNKNNPVNSITSDQLQDILLGKNTKWKDFGGPDKKILVVAREGKISGVGYMTRKIIFGDQDIDYTSEALLVKSSGPLENKIQLDEFAIGITGVSSARKRISMGKQLKILSVDGQEASRENIASGAYPTFRPLYISTQGKPTGEVKKFLDWLVSDEGQHVIESVGTVSLKQGAGLKDTFEYWMNTDKIVNFHTLP